MEFILWNNVCGLPFSVKRMGNRGYPFPFTALKIDIFHFTASNFSFFSVAEGHLISPFSNFKRACFTFYNHISAFFQFPNLVMTSFPCYRGTNFPFYSQKFGLFLFYNLKNPFSILQGTCCPPHHTPTNLPPLKME